jgi:hypothetical protein
VVLRSGTSSRCLHGLAGEEVTRLVPVVADRLGVPSETVTYELAASRRADTRRTETVNAAGPAPTVVHSQPAVTRRVAVAMGHR